MITLYRVCLAFIHLKQPFRTVAVSSFDGWRAVLNFLRKHGRQVWGRAVRLEAGYCGCWYRPATAMTRTPANADAARQSGSEAVIADALNRATTVAAVPAPSRASIMPVMTSLGAADEQRPAFHLPRTDIILLKGAISTGCRL
ncbi:MAG: hypothetical protein J2P48_16445 [Alphaproteobacteria bacterium]|nr:hypothetical protein [Alphaproteobacteria bacterium]